MQWTAGLDSTDAGGASISLFFVLIRVYALEAIFRACESIRRFRNSGISDGGSKVISLDLGVLVVVV